MGWIRSTASDLLMLRLTQYEKNYMAYRYQLGHCVAALPAKISVFNSHLHGSPSVVSNKPRLPTKKYHIGTIKTQKACVTNKGI